MKMKEVNALKIGDVILFSVKRLGESILDDYDFIDFSPSLDTPAELSSGTFNVGIMLRNDAQVYIMEDE